jgi:hypothetical protein
LTCARPCSIARAISSKRRAAPLIALLQAEGGKTLDDAVAEVREADDFCRYYAVEARRALLSAAIARGRPANATSCAIVVAACSCASAMETFRSRSFWARWPPLSPPAMLW